MISATKKKRGGEDLAGALTHRAATRKHKVGDGSLTSVTRYADLPSGEILDATEDAVAAGETKNGRATRALKPIVEVPRRSKTKRGAGGVLHASEGQIVGSAATTNGAARMATPPIKLAPRRSRTRGSGEHTRDTDLPAARPAETNGRAKGGAKPTTKLHGHAADGDRPSATDVEHSICRQLIPLQRARVAALKMRIRVDNGIGSFVASQLGDNASLDDAERQKLRKVADELVACVWKGKPLKHPEHEAVIAANLGMIEAAGIGSRAFQSQIDLFEKQMESLVKQLPLAAWLEQPEQRGIGLVSVAKIIGECGDLADYRNPSCVWKRMGCAPYQGKMPSTWRSGKEGKASAEDWVAMGYNPRRRSLMYVIGEGIVKQNGDGPYRKRYDEAKATFQEKHPDYSKGRCHAHGMLLAAKLLLKNLWIEMRK